MAATLLSGDKATGIIEQSRRVVDMAALEELDRWKARRDRNRLSAWVPNALYAIPHVEAAIFDRCPVVLVGFPDDHLAYLLARVKNEAEVPIFTAAKDVTFEELRSVKEMLRCRLCVVSMGDRSDLWVLERPWLSEADRLARDRERARARRERQELERLSRAEAWARGLPFVPPDLDLPAFVWEHLMYEQPVRSSSLDLCAECGSALRGPECPNCGVADAGG